MLFCAWVQHANHSATEPPSCALDTLNVCQGDEVHGTQSDSATGLSSSRGLWSPASFRYAGCHHSGKIMPAYFPIFCLAACFSRRHTHTHLTALCPGLPGWASTRKVKPIWILLKQETVSGSGISWAICKSASSSRQKTMPVPHYSSFFTGRMPFLPPNQQHQSTEGTIDIE